MLSTCGPSHMKYPEWVTCHSPQRWVKNETLEGPGPWQTQHGEPVLTPVL